MRATESLKWGAGRRGLFDLLRTLAGLMLRNAHRWHSAQVFYNDGYGTIYKLAPRGIRTWVSAGLLFLKIDKLLSNHSDTMAWQLKLFKTSWMFGTKRGLRHGWGSISSCNMAHIVISLGQIKLVCDKQVKSVYTSRHCISACISIFYRHMSPLE